jgi:hypothetical protein
MFIAEAWLEHAARAIGMDRHEMIRINLFANGENVNTYFEQPVCSSSVRFSDSQDF